MGIRMLLAVGYGLDLNVFGDLRADRSQLRYDSIEDAARFAAFKAEASAWANQHGELMDKFIWHESYNPPKDLAGMIVYDGEFGFDDRMLLQPAGSAKGWTRYGNLMDAFLFEAQRGSDAYDNDLAPEWLRHPGTLYPYVGLMKPNAQKPLGVEKYCPPCYQNRPEHKDAVAWAPWHLWFVIKHLRLWPENMTTQAFLSLRPTIYRYWS